MGGLVTQRSRLYAGGSLDSLFTPVIVVLLHGALAGPGGYNGACTCVLHLPYARADPCDQQLGWSPANHSGVSVLKRVTLEVSLHAASRTSAPLVHIHEFAGCRFAGALCSAACTSSACLPP
eukprot:4646799-Lingulodinium_polyedra.AAC.1